MCVHMYVHTICPLPTPPHTLFYHNGTLLPWVTGNVYLPLRYLLVRYEDLGLQPEETARRIFKFLQLTYHKSVASFVRDHTSINRKTKKKPSTYSTYRDSKSTTFAWRGALNFTTLEEIQNVCREPLSYLKLRVFETEEDYTNATIPVLLE